MSIPLMDLWLYIMLLSTLQPGTLQPSTLYNLVCYYDSACLSCCDLQLTIPVSTPRGATSSAISKMVWTLALAGSDFPSQATMPLVQVRTLPRSSLAD